MISRRFSAWQKVVALAPALLVVAYLPAEAMLRCRMDGVLRAACCCPEKKEAPSAQPALKAADCCEREIASSERPAMAADRAPDVRQLTVEVSAPFVASVLPAIPSAARIDRSAQRYGPAREGPPLILLKHAFLI